MKITKEETEKLAKLARLKFSEKEIEKMTLEMSGILNYVDQLKEVDEKISSALIDPDGINLTRNDVVDVTIQPEELLQSAPDREGNFYKVKSVLD
jgi:aspartyl-tRNA(Asn)/glutamyl-tRNA(Gln) amidotransferase subunit C